MSKKTLIIVGSVVILLLTLTLIPSKKDESSPSRSQARDVSIQPAPAEPLEGTVTITGKAWEHAPGKSCFTPGKWINAYIVTPGIHWQVQFDNDPKRVFDLYPKDWKTNSVLVVTNTHNLQRWRVDPKYHDRDTVATVVWRIESVQAE
jgi:hypothetical protein